ncbi:hypothetical protein BS47DRAFT_1359099 [Hydnum rufescens UP504]|uniref:Uncharacterized protein n=1 Tax=Hydnum rufescens UP504 TaxID=1448309 RepID=A0A9P6B672_9AGAM|nr:hypothetical protein BS47DRAFT_1359099 [Hydnum rufescens UP504]
MSARNQKRQLILCRPLRSRKQEEGEARIQQDPEAAEVAEGLEGLGDEGDSFSEFPAEQFEEPPGSEEQRGLLGLPTVSETEVFGPNALHKAYSKGLGEALKDTGAPSSSESDHMVPSFEDSTTEGEYMSGLEEVMNNERNPKDLARLEAERAMRLESWQARAAELAEEHAEWHCQTKGKGKETVVEADDEAEEEEFDEAHTKPLVSRLTKSQTEHVKQQGNHTEGLGMILPGSTLQRILTMVWLQQSSQRSIEREGKSLQGGKGGLQNVGQKYLYSTGGNQSQSKLENIFRLLKGLHPQKLGKDLSEKSHQNYNLYDLAAVGFVTALDSTDGAAIANASVFAPSKKIGDIVEQIFWMPANKWKFIALNLAEAVTFEPSIKGWEAYAEANPLEDLHSTVSGKLLEMARKYLCTVKGPLYGRADPHWAPFTDRVLKQNSILEGWAKKGWPYVGLANIIYDLLNKDKGVSFRIHNWPSTCAISKKAETYIQSELKCVLQSIVVGFVKGAQRVSNLSAWAGVYAGSGSGSREIKNETLVQQ